jgi:hypothetical protein
MAGVVGKLHRTMLYLHLFARPNRLRTYFTVSTAMSFNALDRNARPQAIWALGDDWRCWRRS